MRDVRPPERWAREERALLAVQEHARRALVVVAGSDGGAGEALRARPGAGVSRRRREWTLAGLDRGRDWRLFWDGRRWAVEALEAPRGTSRGHEGAEPAGQATGCPLLLSERP